MTRTAIPNRRQSTIVPFEHGGIRFYGSVSMLPDGTPCEIFLQGGKAGTALESIARDSAVAASIALQYSAPLDVLRGAMTRLDDGAASGPLGKMLDMVLT